MDTYEKKYNEAFEQAKKELVACGSMDCDAARLIFRLFPQLRESEDERIRKALVWHLKADVDFVSNGVTKAECLAYLEKQKEHHIPWYDYQKSKEAGYTIVPNEEYEQLIKQKEHKPVECSEVELEFRGEKVTVKRPFYRDDKGRGYSTAELDEGVAWNALRAWCEKKGISLYDLYPKAEWSEEDEDMLNSCISSIEEAKENRYAYKETDGDTSYDHEIAWLKSLRPDSYKNCNSRWKPSEEQIYSLGTVVKGAGENSIGSIAYNLKELYEELKKL